ncbi:ferredoxin [Frankia sp. Cas3]|uniref:ferredoxin n=1 Tax=Frankia sp. Cas3 TaxID=3073926 RepID=UPI002AD39A55|nr:ferredoxin [Frankia sp. Cas3]
MKVYVDPARCRGHARCISSAPAEFDFLDLEDLAVVRPGAAQSGSPAAFREAARQCPEHAIVIETDEE